MVRMEFGSIERKLLAVFIVSFLLSALVFFVLGSMILIANIILMVISYLLIRKIALKPLKMIAEKTSILSMGDTEVQIEAGYLRRKDEVGRISRELASLAESIQRKSEAVKRISEGDLLLEFTPRSNKDLLGNNLALLINMLRSLAKETEVLSTAAAEGNLETRGNVDDFPGSYREIIGAFNNTRDVLADLLNTAFTYVEAMSRGKDLDGLENSYQGAYGALVEELILMESVMDTLCGETMKLTEATAAGELSVRADTSKMEGRYAEILQGFNKSLDYLIAPLHEMADNLEKIGKGEIPERITGVYKGELNLIKNSINACIDGLCALVEGQDVLCKMSMNDYSVKVDGNYLGIYSDISKSVNLVNDRMNSVMDMLNHIAAGELSDLETIKRDGRKSENDQLTPCLVYLMETIKTLYEETNVLCSAARDGHLAFRGDAKKFHGQFEKIIDGINETVDAITAPISEALNVMQEVAHGNLGVTVTGNYKGDHAELKNALNDTIENLLRFIREISETLLEIGEGNLNLAITADYRGDFAEIKDSLNNIIITMRQVFGDISDAAEQVASSSKQVSGGSQNLSRRATEQAGTIQELTSSVEGVADQTKQNALNANRANELAASARNLAEKGNDQMQEMLYSMKEINASSENISKIIKVIDDIAFQTNILALNAAVEAARAGQHGKGFVVVAEEVRNLAARSAAAARETANLIEGSIGKVKSGTKIANDTASALAEIVSGISEAAALVGGIAESSNEQAVNITQINNGIERVFELVRMNSSTAEKGAAASEELSGQAELLTEMVSRFRGCKGEKDLLSGSQILLLK